jgi:hypothetical protein
MGTVEAGVSIIKLGQFNLSFAYQGEFGRAYTRDGAVFRASVSF